MLGTACAASRKAKQGERPYLEHNYVLLGHHAKHGETGRKTRRKSKSFILFNPHKDLEFPACIMTNYSYFTAEKTEAGSG